MSPRICPLNRPQLPLRGATFWAFGPVSDQARGGGSNGFGAQRKGVNPTLCRLLVARRSLLIVAGALNKQEKVRR
jgi:hypothetical protein